MTKILTRYFTKFLWTKNALQHIQKSLISLIFIGSTPVLAANLPQCFSHHGSYADMLLNTTFHIRENLPVPKHSKTIDVIENRKNSSILLQYHLSKHGQLIEIKQTLTLKNDTSVITVTTSMPNHILIKRESGDVLVKVTRKKYPSFFSPLIINEEENRASLDTGFGHGWNWTWDNATCRVTTKQTLSDGNFEFTVTYNDQGSIINEMVELGESPTHLDNSGYQLELAPKLVTKFLTTFLYSTTGNRIATLKNQQYLPAVEEYNDRGHWVSKTNQFQTTPNTEPNPIIQTIRYYK